MKKLKILKPVRDKQEKTRLKTGDVIERSNARASEFIDGGFAEEIKEKKKKKDDE